MIKTRKELKFFLMADEIMNEQVFPHGFFKRILVPNPIQQFMRCMRKLEYCEYKKNKNKLFAPLWLYYRIKYNKLSVKTGFDIPLNSLGYGCRIGHRCGIIISGGTKIGNYCSIHRCSCADGNPKQIGNNVFIGTNVVLAKTVKVPDGCSISAVSFLNKSIDGENQLWGGVPAKFLKDSHPWTDEQPYKDEFEKCEALRLKMNLLDL